MGMLIYNGGIPYTDAFDHKPPIIYLLNFLGHCLTPNSAWGGFIILNIIGFLSVILVYRVAKKIIVSPSFSYILTLLYIAFINTHTFIRGGNYTRQVAAYLVVYIIASSILYKKTKYLLGIIGVLFSLIFFTQQNEVIALFPLLGLLFFTKQSTTLISTAKGIAANQTMSEPFQLSTIFSIRGVKNYLAFDNWKNIRTHLLYFSIGATLPMLGLLFLFAYWHNFNEFIYQAFSFNFEFYTDSGQNYFYKLLKTTKKILRVYPPLVILLLLAIDYTFLRVRTISKIQLALLSGLLLQLFSTAISGKAYHPYYLLFLPYALFFAIYAFQNFKSASSYFIRFTILLILGYLVYIKANSVAKISYVKKPTALTSSIAKIAGKKGALYVFDPSYLWLNTDYNIIAPSKWVYSHFAFYNSDPEGLVLDTIVQDINKYETTYILMPTLDERYQAFHQLIEEKYVATEVRDGDYVLYRRGF